MTIYFQLLILSPNLLKSQSPISWGGGGGNSRWQWNVWILVLTSWVNLEWTTKFWQENLQPSLSECITDSFPSGTNNLSSHGILDLPSNPCREEKRAFDLNGWGPRYNTQWGNSLLMRFLYWNLWCQYYHYCLFRLFSENPNCEWMSLLAERH